MYSKENIFLIIFLYYMEILKTTVYSACQILWSLLS